MVFWVGAALGLLDSWLTVIVVVVLLYRYSAPSSSRADPAACATCV